MGHHFAVLIQIFIFTAIAGTYLFFRPTRILLTADSLVIHSAHKDDVYDRKSLVYRRPVEKATWSRGLCREFGIGWPFPLAGKFSSPAFGEIVIASITQPNILNELWDGEKTLLLQLSEDQVKELQSPRPTEES